MESVGFDDAKQIEMNADTTLGYGTELRIVAQLRPLLGRYLNFESLSLVPLTNGMTYVFINDELDSATKLDELKTLAQRGNHKSAKDFPI